MILLIPSRRISKIFSVSFYEFYQELIEEISVVFPFFLIPACYSIFYMGFEMTLGKVNTFLSFTTVFFFLAMGVFGYI